MPDRVPMHWNLAGQVDRYGSKWEGLLFVPVMLLIMGGVFMVIGIVSGNRLKVNTVKALNVISAAMVVFFLAIHNALLSGDHNKLIGMLPMLLSGLLLVMGFAIRGVEPNPFVGIRVPWTMNSPTTWRMTHDRASKLWIWGGLLGLISAVFGLSMGVSIAIFAGCTLYPLLDSYFISKSQT